MPELWTKGLAEIKERIDKQNYETWFKPIRFVSRNKNEIVLEVPNKFFRDWLTEHYVRQMENLLSGIAAQEVKVLFQINEELETRPRQEKILKKEQREAAKPQRSTNLIAKYTFDNFIIGTSNQFAHAACMAVANQPGDHYNPLFIYGGVGLGKTHLVNAIGH
ncbi:MAG TPA: DnaA/Hda family protein, partial [Chitinophagaceae bacterium]|nr:DnaA/Hda family protein [Chitinophagaceae bacterium]